MWSPVDPFPLSPSTFQVDVVCRAATPCEGRYYDRKQLYNTLPSAGARLLAAEASRLAFPVASPAVATLVHEVPA